jgi:CRISPR-associated protein Cas2
MANEQNWLITYDIANPGRLQRVAKIMESYGVRLQKSVFECLLRPGDLQRLLRKLEKEMDTATDGIKCFPLCKRCEQKCTVLGANSDANQHYAPFLID